MRAAATLRRAELNALPQKWRALRQCTTNDMKIRFARLMPRFIARDTDDALESSSGQIIDRR